jgi:threonine/homoserine/homoserine lactone efflux protein
VIVPLGFLIGFISAIPLGPVNIFIISQTLKRGFLHGFFGVLTTVFLDFLYCLIALIGIFNITINITQLKPVLKVVAAVLLTAIAIRLFKESRTEVSSKPPQKLLRTYPRPVIGVILLYTSNPTLYAFWLAVAGSVTAHHLVTKTGWPPVVFAIACGLGSIFWHLILISYVSKHHSQFQSKIFKKILQVLGIVLIGFACYSLVTLFFEPWG